MSRYTEDTDYPDEETNLSDHEDVISDEEDIEPPHNEEVPENNGRQILLTEEMTNNLREFIHQCELIKGSKEELKILNERKNELEAVITQFMINNDIPAFKTPNGRISVYNAKSTKPLNKDYLLNTISEKIPDRKMAEELTEMAFAKRPTTETRKIKVIPKRNDRDA